MHLNLSPINLRRDNRKNLSQLPQTAPLGELKDIDPSSIGIVAASTRMLGALHEALESRTKQWNAWENGYPFSSESEQVKGLPEWATPINSPDLVQKIALPFSRDSE